MNRNTRLLIVLGIAVFIAALASLGVYTAIRRRPAVEVEVPSKYVVVASQTLEMGIKLSKDDVKLVAWPERNLIPGAFDKVETVVDRGLIAPVLLNEPITESKLAPTEAGAGLPPAIKPGMRAMSVKVNEVIGVAGFIVPGARVDVLVTMRSERDSGARVVVSNVQVLAAGTRFDQGEAAKEAKPIPTTVVTLMVGPSDAEKIALASSEGQIMLALRNPLDTAVAETTGVRTAALLAAPSAAPPVARRPAQPKPAVIAEALPPPPPPPPPPKVVETYKDTKRGQEIIQ